MFKHQGIWLPDGETHLTGMLDRGPFIDGKGTYQYKKYQQVLAFTPDRNTAIDVGAHVGLWSMHLAKHFAAVVAFEPVEAHRACFLKNLEGHPNLEKVILHPFIAGDRETNVALRFNSTSSGDTWVDPEAGPGPYMQVLIDSFNVENVSLIKLDCEGYELFALKGAEETIKKWKPTVIVEQKPGRAEKFGLQRTQAVTYLEGLGMSRRLEMSGDFILGW